MLLAGCSTLEIAHAKLECLLYPELSLADRMTDEELDSFTDPVWLKTTEHIVSYQERINSICELISKHNKAHE